MSEPTPAGLLVAGGAVDPNVRAVARRAPERGLRVEVLAVEAEASPAVTWDLRRDTLTIDGRVLTPDAMFLRHDVFTWLADPRPETGDRAHAWWAVEAGLAVPDTRVSNDLTHLGGWAVSESLVAKTVTDGGYCRTFHEAVAAAEHDRTTPAGTPAIVQEHLVQPESRVFAVGDRYLAFEVSSDRLDYRLADDCTIRPARVAPEDLLTGLRRLVETLGLDFAAADFKTSPKDGRLRFLEINSMPMFTAFDGASGGALVDALVRWLGATG